MTLFLNTLKIKYTSIYCWNKFPVMLLNLLMRTFVFIALTIVLSCPLRSYADPVAQIIGAPTGLTNQTNPVISIAGDGVVAYKYKLDGGEYSDEIPVNTPITFSADVNIFGLNFTAGNTDLQDFLDYRDDFIDSVIFSNVDVDTPIVFLLNPIRMTLQNENILYVKGSNIDQLDVHMNDSPNVPAVIVNQSLSGGSGYITYEVQSDAPETDYIRIINRSSNTASFKVNLNNMLFASDDDVLNEIQAMPPEYGSEPIERKVWRFIRDNRYHWYPIMDEYWDDYWWPDSSPALFFNSIGFGFCADAAALYCQLMTSLGYQTRIWSLNGHIVPEVLIDGKWKLYDPDLQVYYYNYQGEVAGVEELAAHPDLITNPINPIPDTLHGVDSNGVRWEYSPTVADAYSSVGDNVAYPWYYDDTMQNYLLNIQVPSGGIFEFPAVFAAPIHTSYDEDAPFYTNARLTIPRGWTGTLNTPLVIHSIGYDGPHTLSVVAKDSSGNWQTTPTVATWTTDSWAPITALYQPHPTDPVTLTTNEPATIYYTVDNSTPTTSSPVYNGPISITLSTTLKFFAIDMAGNREGVKCYNAPPVSSVSLTMDKSSPQVEGAVITFTAAATGSSGLYEYYFVLRNPNTGQWSVSQSYSSNPGWIWNTAGIDTGTYEIQVLARSAGSTASYEAYKDISYAINPPPVSSVSLTTDKSSPQVQGAVITFTAAATGGSGTYEYMFRLSNPITGQWGVVWGVGQAYSGNPVWQWNTTGLSPGIYIIQVWARNVGSTASYEALTGIKYTLSPPVPVVALTTDIPSPQTVGAVITFVAKASGGSGTYEYLFYLWNPVTGQWSIRQGYSGNGVWQWNTSGTDLGTYEIQVWARSAGSTAACEAWKGVSYVITTPSPVSSVSLSTDKSSPQVQGAVITFTAAATGGTGSYEYIFWLRNPNTGQWSLGQAYSSNPSWIWNTTGIDTGTYSIQVWVRSAGSAEACEAWKGVSYVIM